MWMWNDVRAASLRACVVCRLPNSSVKSLMNIKIVMEQWRKIETKWQITHLQMKGERETEKETEKKRTEIPNP